MPIILYCLKNTTAWIFTDHLDRSSFLPEEVEEVDHNYSQLLLLAVLAAVLVAALAAVQESVLPALR